VRAFVSARSRDIRYRSSEWQALTAAKWSETIRFEDPQASFRPQETLEHPPELSIRLPTRVSWSRLIILIATTVQKLQFRIDVFRDQRHLYNQQSKSR